MAEAESELNSHVITREGSTDPRVKTTQILSATFLENVIKALVRRGDTALTPWLGPDQPRGFPSGNSLSPIPGFTFQDGLGLDTVSNPGTVSVLSPGGNVATPSDWYGDHDVGRITGLTCRRAAGSIEQGPVFFDLDLGNEIGVTNVPFASTTTTYTVSMNFSTIPKTVEANPRTGAFEYVEEHTVLGVAMEPDEVNDLGGGSVELVFPDTGDDTKFIATDSMAGRTATAWLANGPLTTTANAIESATVTFSSGRNRVTIGDLGQGVVSTDPADYRVMVRGLTVTDYLFDISGATGILADMDSGALIGVINFSGVADKNVVFGLVAPTFTNILDDVLDLQNNEGEASGDGSLRQAVKIEVKLNEWESPADNEPQIAIRTNSANVKYAGSISWGIDEEGIQDHVTTREDFLYVQDDAGLLGSFPTAQRTYTRAVSPLDAPIPSVDVINSTAAKASMDYLNDAGTVSWQSLEATTNDLYFFVPARINGCVVEEISMFAKKGDPSDIIEVEFGIRGFNGAFTSLLGPFASTSGGAYNLDQWTAPGDFTEYEVSDGSDNGTLANSSPVFRIRMRNGTGAAGSCKVTTVECKGRLLKNYPITP